MRRRQRRDSAREWIRAGATVTISSYAKRYGVADHQDFAKAADTI